MKSKPVVTRANFKLWLSITLISMALVFCGQACDRGTLGDSGTISSTTKTEGNGDYYGGMVGTVEKSVQDILSAVSGANKQIGGNSESTPSLPPSEAPNACPGPDTLQCISGEKSVEFLSCTPTNAPRARLSGVSNVSFSNNACMMNQPGDSFSWTYNLELSLYKY